MKTYMDKIRATHPNFAKVLEMQCDAINVPYSVVNKNVKNKKWFQRYTWTLKQENEFEKKLVDWIYKNPEARREFNNLPKIKWAIKRWVRWYLFDYGWMTND